MFDSWQIRFIFKVEASMLKVWIDTQPNIKMSMENNQIVIDGSARQRKHVFRLNAEPNKTLIRFLSAAVKLYELLPPWVS